MLAFAGQQILRLVSLHTIEWGAGRRASVTGTGRVISLEDRLDVIIGLGQ